MRTMYSEKGHAYKILGLNIGRGGYGFTYEALSLADAKKVVIKIPRLDSSRTFPDLEKRVEEFNKSLRAEFRCLRRLERVESVAHALDFGHHPRTIRGLDLDPAFIVQEFVKGANLDAYLRSLAFRKFVAMRRGRFSGIRDVRKFFTLASKIAFAVAQVHKCEVVHGDLWPPNIRVRPNGDPVVIDFGESVLVDLVLLATRQPQSHPYAAPERRDLHGRWSSGADIYSLGGILFFMATGEDPPRPILDWDELKTKVAHRIKECNPGLYSANSGIADVIARCLRFHDRDRPSFAEGIVEELSIYLNAPRTRAPRLSEAMGSLERSVKKLVKSKSEVFSHIAAARVRTLGRQFDEMSYGLYTLGGHYENMARGLAESLSLLERGDSYLTVSIPSFWGTGGFGRNGRFLETNKVVGQRGVNIGRVFLLTPDEERSEYVCDILKAHLRVVRELEKGKRAIPTKKWSTSRQPRGYYTGVFVDRDGKRGEGLEFKNFGIWSKAKSDQDVLILPAYREKEASIAAVRFWAPAMAREQIEKLKYDALELMRESTPLSDFFKSRSMVKGAAGKQDRRRESPRERNDERQVVMVDWGKRTNNGTKLVENVSARVRDHSLSGISLTLELPPNGIPRRGDVISLKGKPNFTGEWAASNWSQNLKVRWARKYKGPGLAECTVGLQKMI